MKQCCSNWPAEEVIRVSITAAGWLFFGGLGVMEATYGQTTKAGICMLAGMAVHAMQSVQARSYRTSRVSALNTDRARQQEAPVPYANAK